MKLTKRHSSRLIALFLTFIIATSIVGCAGNANSESADSTTEISVSESTAVSPSDEEISNNDTSDIDSSEVDAIEESNSPETVSDSSEDSSSDELASAELDASEAAAPTDEISEEENEEPTPNVTEPPVADNIVEDYEEENDNGLSSTQRNSINMLNYMTVLTQEINESKGNQLFLESAYSSLVNDIFPNSVDTKTQAQITSLMDTVDSYRMIAVKRDRILYIYEQNQAQALRQAIPNPVGLLSAVQSGSLLKAAASVLYMAVDAKTSYDSARSQADLQFLKDGWELDDAENAELHNSTKNALNYMLNMVRDYDLPGDYALNEESVKAFVTWSSKPDSQLIGKISWLEGHESTYSEFGPYWLELAKDYYNSGDYENCLNSVANYESIATRIFRKDIDYATALPMAIISAKETKSSEEYIAIADKYCKAILDNTKDEDWTLRYFAAQIYMDLYAQTQDSAYLDKAYTIAFDNVNVLVDEQRALNSAYLADIVEAEAGKNATKREKEEVKSYNKSLKEERKIALPPVNEALYLNCDLLFALAEERGISASEQNKIESILHVGGENIFLTQALDNRFWFNGGGTEVNADEVTISFDGEKFIIPAACVTDRSNVVVTITGTNGTTTIEDWTVTNVKRPKNSTVSEYEVTYESKEGKKYKYQAGETITIKVIPVEESPEEYLEFTYNVVATKKVVVFNGIKFERVTE